MSEPSRVSARRGNRRLTGMRRVGVRLAVGGLLLGAAAAAEVGARDGARVATGDGVVTGASEGTPDTRAGFFYRDLDLAGDVRRYALWVPAVYDVERAWPLVVFLHGSGECGTDGEKQTRVGLGPALTARPAAWPCLVLMPQKPSAGEEWEEHEDLVLAAIADVRQAYHVDPDRIALTGISQGGHGVWYIGARHGGLFSCLAPVCGYGRARTIAGRVAELPVWAFHGLRDDVVDPQGTQKVVAEIQAIKRERGRDPGEARLTLYPEANHNSWDAAYAEPGLPGWLLGQARARPARP